MAGSLKWFEYVDNAGVTFAIFMDKSNGIAVGNPDYTPASTALFKLPRNIKARVATYRNTAGTRTRIIPISSNVATAQTLPPTINAQIAGSAAGEELALVRFAGEIFTVIPRADDTGLNDGTPD